MDDLAVPGADDVIAAAAAAYGLFATAFERDWSVAAGDLEWDCRTTLEHVANVQIMLAVNAANQSRGRLAPTRSGDPARSVAELAQVHGALAAVLAATLRSMPADARGFHPAGLADRHGFAAMACTETLVHAGDIAQGLGLDFTPPQDVAARALARLFPWVQADGDAWSLLRYATGRTGLADAPRKAPNWWWHCAPLSEWDGTVKERPSA